MKMRNGALAAAWIAGVCLTSTPVLADTKVVASIKPIHSLVAAVMEGAGVPDLVVEGAATPHSYALKPSQAKKLEDAAVIFWVGHELEAFFEKPVETIGKDAVSVSLLDSHDLEKLDFREGGAFAHHEHQDHDDEDHDHDHEAKDHDHDHNHEAKDHDHDGEDHDHAADDHGHDHDSHSHEAGQHAHSGVDGHIWLDPKNAKVLVKEIAHVLSEVDPENAALYEENAKNTLSRLDSLIDDVESRVKPVQGRPFVVFHDAYRYFEQRFGVTAVGSIAINPDIAPGADRLAEIRDEIRETGAVCVFAEPQFQSRHIETVTEGTNARIGILDPLGAGLEDGPDLYFNLIREMANSMRDCLSIEG